LFGYGVDAVIANRLLPDSVSDPWFDQWKQLHAQHLATIESGFAPVPVLRADLSDTEVVGFDRLRTFGEQLYGQHDPAAVLHHARPMSVKRHGTTQVLALELPFADHDDLEVGRHGDELLVRVGPHRRAIMLPDSLRRRRVVSAKLRDGSLRVAFAEGTMGSTDHETAAAEAR
jgi:arsenite-transporting ATPase